MAKKSKNLRGIAKAEQLQYKRSKRAKSSDINQRAMKTVQPTKDGIAEWQKSPNRVDIYSVDTPEYCRICGRHINSKWKGLCYKCYHKEKSDFKANKLQKMYGGTK